MPQPKGVVDLSTSGFDHLVIHYRADDETQGETAEALRFARRELAPLGEADVSSPVDSAL